MVPTATAPAMRFVDEHSRLLDFAVFTAAAFVNRKSDGDPAEWHDQQRRSEEMLQELILTRTVDNFLCFVSELLALIYKTKPQMLRSADQERIDYILDFHNMDELRTAIAEKKVERLSFLGLRDLSEWLKSQIGFELFPSVDELRQASLLVEMRNICVHSRGVVGSLSSRRFAEFRNELGKKLDFSHERIREFRCFLENAVFDIDVRATEKFTLPAIQVPEPPEYLIGPA